jgi:hypothetical protein
VEIPEALLANYDNGISGVQDILAVPDDGYTTAGEAGKIIATKFETLTASGITGAPQVFALLRYHFASLRQRPELLTMLLPYEHLRVQRGDVVRLLSDVLQFGLGWGWIVDTPSATVLRTGEKFTLVVGKTYEVAIRLADMTTVIRTVTTPSSGQVTDTLTTSVPHGAAPGNLMGFGETGKVGVRHLVVSVTSQQPLNAQVGLARLGSGVYDAGSAVVPPFASQVSPRPAVSIVKGWLTGNGSLKLTINAGG